MIRFSAKYYDGQTSHAHDVDVSFDHAGLLQIEGLAEGVQHVISDVRVAPRLGDTMRSLSLPDGAKCETLDNAAVDALERATGRGRGNAFIHGLESRWRAAIVASALLALLIVSGIKWGIPAAAKQMAHAVPDELAYDLGQGTLSILDRTMLKASTLAEARKIELQAKFETIGKDYPKLPLKLHFRRGVGPNAFALPDGTVIVSDELVELARDDAQILGVIAHEIGHVHHRHSLRMALESSSVVAIIAAYLGDTAQVTTLSAALPAVYAQAHYSREHETEADTFAIRYLIEHGIATQHYADILRALQKAHGSETEGALQYLASHPPTAERIQRFEKRER